MKVNNLAVILVLLAAGSGACKKKSSNKAAPAPAPKVASDALGDGCQAKLALVEPLPKVNPQQLKLSSGKIEEFLIGSYKAAKLSFELDAASAVPDRIIYSVCSTSNGNDCQRGATASPSEYNALLPAGAIKMQAWACIGPERLLMGSSQSQLEIKDFGAYYCGAPVTVYGHQGANPGGEAFAKAQAEIVALRNEATRLAFELHGIVSNFVSKGSNDPALVGIANSPKEVFAESALYLYEDAKMATAYGVKKAESAGSGAGLKLASTDGGCVPEVTDEELADAFTPPPVVTPKVAEKTPEPAKKPAETKPPAVDLTIESQNDCKTRNEFLSSQGKGTATWDASTLRCFVANTSEQSQILDSSAPPEEVVEDSPTTKASKNSNSSKKLSPTQQAGVSFIVLGGLLAAGAGAVAVDGGVLRGEAGKGWISGAVDIEVAKKFDFDQLKDFNKKLDGAIGLLEEKIDAEITKEQTLKKEQRKGRGGEEQINYDDVSEELKTSDQEFMKLNEDLDKLKAIQSEFDVSAVRGGDVDGGKYPNTIQDANNKLILDKYGLDVNSYLKPMETRELLILDGNSSDKIKPQQNSDSFSGKYKASPDSIKKYGGNAGVFIGLGVVVIGGLMTGLELTESDLDQNALLKNAKYLEKSEQISKLLEQISKKVTMSSLALPKK